MKYKEFYLDVLTESKSKVPVIVVDVQPLYHSHCEKISRRLMDFLNGRTGKVLAFFNGPEIGGDSKYDTVEYFIDNGMDERTLQVVEFREKTYAFFRNWMDRGMDRGHIIKAIRYMVMKRRRDSRDVTNEEWEAVFGDDWGEWTDIPEIVDEDPIFIPEISISELKSFSGGYLCGGAKDECLAEFRLILDAFNIKYKLMRELIY
jgi:hypothetical protein